MNRCGGESFHQLQLEEVQAWLNVDLARTQRRSVDLLYRSTGGHLVHLEVQSSNDPSMPLRMAEYALAIKRMYRLYPEQLILFVGNEPMRMTPGFREKGMVFCYRQADIRDLDGTRLLASDSIADNILGLLAGLDDPVKGVRTLLGRIAALKRALQVSTLELFLLACQIRGLETIARKEIQTMPQTLQIDIEKWPFLQEALAKRVHKEVRREVRKEAEKFREQGREEGRVEGLEEGIKEAVRLLLNKRFGRLPTSVVKRLAAMSDAQAKDLTLAILDAKSLKDLFGPTRR
jgi:predicted transposase YdaD